MRIADRIGAAADTLTPAERRVAAAVAAEPSAVAFGTVADLARRSGTSGPTVLRLAQKLGFDGFAALQGAVRSELESQLRPAAVRIREHDAGHPLGRALARSVAAVQATLAEADRATFDRAVALLAGRRRQVHVVSGEATAGVAQMAADALDLLRPGVRVVAGSPVGVARRLAHVAPGDVVLAVDLRRYERWVLDATTAASEAGATVIAVTDSLLSPLADLATERLVVTAEGPGPFDTHVGTLALLDALVAGVADRLRTSAADRLDAVERSWADHLVD
jgi:DNA-binding MurR/RpiR family transcriptional regulator